MWTVAAGATASDGGSSLTAGRTGGVEWIADPARLAALTPAWSELAGGAWAPFTRPAWFAAWWAAFGGHELAVCALHEGGEVTGIFPLARRHGTLTALANHETPTFKPLARDDGARSRLTHAVVTAADRLHVPALEAGSSAHVALRESARVAGRLDVSRWQFDGPVTDTVGDFEAYRQPRRRAWRELERRGRKLEREHDVSFELIVRPAALEPELRDGLRLEASGWKGGEGTAILASPAMMRFYRRIARDAHERDELRFSALRVDGRLAAWDLALVHGERYFLLKTAYDESLRGLAPGLVLRRAVIARCFESELEAHEILGIEAPWKRLFTTRSRPHVRYRAYRATVAGHAAHAYRARIRPRAGRALTRLRSRRAP